MVGVLARRAVANVHASAELLLRLVASRWVSAAILVWLGVGASWIALTALVGMVYDERWHLDSIEVFAAQSLPWFAAEAPQEGVGAASRSASYLYHYLLSFPFRWLEGAGVAEVHVVMVLRLITVAIHVAALWCMMRAARAAGASPGVVNLAALGYAALPVVPFLAAQVNYDSLMLLLLAACGWAAIVQLAPGRATWLGIVGAVALGLAAVLTKFNAAPVVLVLLAWVAIAVVRNGRMPALPRTTAGRIGFGVIAVLAAIVISLCFERYVGNLLQYGAPSPDCGEVLGAERCESYLVWERNREADAAFPDAPVSLSGMAQFFFGEWLPRMPMYLQAVWFWHAPPTVSTLVSLATPVAMIAVPAVALCAGAASPVLRRIAPLLVAGAAYIALLFWHNYGEWRAFGEPLGVQGRYLLPVVVPVAVLAIAGTAAVLRTSKIGTLALALGAVGAVLLASQGGVAAFIVSSHPSWFDPGSPLLPWVEDVRRVVDKVISTVAIPSI